MSDTGPVQLKSLTELQSLFIYTPSLDNTLKPIIASKYPKTFNLIDTLTNAESN